MIWVGMMRIQPGGRSALSTMEEKILTKHPQGKSGFNISKQKYDVIRAAIMESLRTKGALAPVPIAPRGAPFQGIDQRKKPRGGSLERGTGGRGTGLTHSELAKTVQQALQGKLEGSVNWYVEVVKLDLEARKVIERMPRTKPQSYRLAQD